MTPLRDILGAVDGMSLEQLERHIQERAECVDRLRSEQAKLIPALDRKWRQKRLAAAGLSRLAQNVSLEIDLV